jgi:hypothetical protein
MSLLETFLRQALVMLVNTLQLPDMRSTSRPLPDFARMCPWICPCAAGALLTLSGPGAYDAAVHCASVSAARRVVTPDQQQQGNNLLTPGGGCSSPSGTTTGATGSAVGSGTPEPTSLMMPPPPVSTHPISSHQISRSNSGSDYSALGSRRSSSSGSGLHELLYDEGASSSSSSGASRSSSEGLSGLAGGVSSQQEGAHEGEGVEGEQEDGSSSDGSARSSRSSSSRRGTGLGRKLRNAISDLLVIR